MNTIKPILVSLTWIPVIFTFTQHVYQPYFIQGRSMTPTFNPGTSSLTNDITLVKKFGVKSANALQRGDIVMFRSPSDPEKLLTKRIIGVAGDKIKPTKKYPRDTAIIPRNHLWLEGDNEFHSVDSNNFGPISQALVIGKVVTIIWPLNRIGTDISKGGRDAIIT